MKFKMDITWVRLIIFKKFYYVILCGRWCSGDLAANVDHMHVKRIHLVGFVYTIIEVLLMLSCRTQWWKQNLKWISYEWHGCSHCCIVFALYMVELFVWLLCISTVRPSHCYVVALHSYGSQFKHSCFAHKPESVNLICVLWIEPKSITLHSTVRLVEPASVS
jgi:hypothetical protein